MGFEQELVGVDCEKEYTQYNRVIFEIKIKGRLGCNNVKCFEFEIKTV